MLTPFRPALSVVAPCYNEAAGLAAFHERVDATCRTLLGETGSWEIVLVNDGSRDATLDVMRELARRDPHVVAVDLSRNYGHQIALTAGLTHCRGERILIIDADLQDPPELLGAMTRAMDEQQADVVFGHRRARAGETVFKKATAALFYRLLRRLVEVPIPLDTGDFRLMNRRTLDILNSMPEQQRFIRGMVAWIGLRQIPFPYDRDVRFAGETGYPFGKMLRFAIDAITSFSVVPLRIASLAGAAIGVLGLAGLFYTLGAWFLGRTVVGWTSVATIVLVIGGAQLMVMGVFGEYLGRLYIETKRRPLFVVSSIISHQSETAAAPRPIASIQTASGS